MFLIGTTGNWRDGPVARVRWVRPCVRIALSARTRARLAWGGRSAADYPRISRWAAAAHRDVGPRISSASRPYGLIRRAGRNGQPIAQTGHESLNRHCDELLGQGHDAEMAPVE